jgi:hypothetical protein
VTIDDPTIQAGKGHLVDRRRTTEPNSGVRPELSANACQAENDRRPGSYCELVQGHAGRHQTRASAGVYEMWSQPDGD